MREIKFRAWDKNNKQWMIGAFDLPKEFQRNHCYAGIDFFFKYLCLENTTLDINSLSQYTGLKDKNGKEIYEGDICKYWMDDRWKKGKVIPLTGGWGIHVTWYGDEPMNAVFHFGSFIPAPYPESKSITMRDQFEVIGNIYENPELLSQ